MKTNQNNQNKVKVLKENDTIKITEIVLADTEKNDTITIIQTEHFIKEKPKTDYGKITVLILIFIFTTLAIIKRIKENKNG